MNILRIYPTSINARFIDRAVDVLKQGGVIAYPTDTFYALGCDALCARAIEKVCRFKGINPDKEALSVVCSDISMASRYAGIDNRAYSILKANLPGAFTFLLGASTRLPKVFKGRRTVGIRIPDNPITVALAEALGNPLLSTSIPLPPDNTSDTVEAMSLMPQIQGVAELMIDGGPGACQGSTVVDLTDSASPEIVRQGKGVLQ